MFKKIQSGGSAMEPMPSLSMLRWMAIAVLATASWSGGAMPARAQSKKDAQPKNSMLAPVKAGDVASPNNSKNSPLIGMWELVVTGFNVYHYKYAISDGSWVATGDVDEGFQGLKFSPTVGAYLRHANGSFRYRERGWVYDQASGANVGTFESVGTLNLNDTGTALTGPGTFTLADLNGVVYYTEPFTVVATKVDVLRNGTDLRPQF